MIMKNDITDFTDEEFISFMHRTAPTSSITPRAVQTDQQKMLHVS